MISALQFSGGKDSLALVHFLRAMWPYVDVIFMDTGDALPSTLERVKEVQAMVPKFTWLQSDALGYRKKHGDPDSETWLTCCATNVYVPMNTYIRSQGYRQVLRGTKRGDPHVHFTFPGDIIDGLLYTFPLWHWTDKDVEDYLGDLCPPEYKRGAIGMPDCKSCTALEMCGGSTKAIWLEQRP